MKKLLLITTIIMMCLCFVSCKEDTTETQPVVTHTIPPTEQIAADAEWAEIDCNIALINDSAETVLTSDDFSMFAVIGSTDEDSYIALKVADTAIDTVKSTNLENSFITIDDEIMGAVSVNSSNFNGEIKLGEDMTYDMLCSLATTIRGLF